MMYLIVNLKIKVKNSEDIMLNYTNDIFFKHEDYEYYKKQLLEQCKIHELEVISYFLMMNN